MDGLTKKITASVVVIVVTLISIYYAWQAIFSIPFLTSIVGIVTAACVICAEVITIWYLFENAKTHSIEHQVRREKLIEENRERKQLPPHY